MHKTQMVRFVSFLVAIPTAILLSLSCASPDRSGTESIADVEWGKLVEASSRRGNILMDVDPVSGANSSISPLLSGITIDKEKAGEEKTDGVVTLPEWSARVLSGKSAAFPKKGTPQVHSLAVLPGHAASIRVTPFLKLCLVPVFQGRDILVRIALHRENSSRTESEAEAFYRIRPGSMLEVEIRGGEANVSRILRIRFRSSRDILQK